MTWVYELFINTPRPFREQQAREKALKPRVMWRHRAGEASPLVKFLCRVVAPQTCASGVTKQNRADLACDRSAAVVRKALITYCESLKEVRVMPACGVAKICHGISVLIRYC